MGTVEKKIAAKAQCDKALERLIELQHGNMNAVAQLLWAMVQSLEHAKEKIGSGGMNG